LSKVVALGGGHGLAATLTALRQVTQEITAIVTVADNGGSSGRLREEFPIFPPGDLRMALAALCADDEWGRTWAEIMQHRFVSNGELNGHAMGNLLLASMWNAGDDPVVALDRVGELLKVLAEYCQWQRLHWILKEHLQLQLVASWFADKKRLQRQRVILNRYA
jgi:uncharacterized cofD-like protein